MTASSGAAEPRAGTTPDGASRSAGDGRMTSSWDTFCRVPGAVAVVCVDLATQRRTPRTSARPYADLARTSVLAPRGPLAP
jgi:hypothetical protein